MKITVAEKYANLSDFIRRLPDGNHPIDEVIRDHRNILTRITADGKRYIVKQYIRPRLLNRIVYTFFRKSKARRSFEYAQELIRQGIGTADPVAWIEIRRGGLFHTGFFISECIDEPLLAEFDRFEDRDKILEQFAAFTAELHGRGIVHHDYNEYNILFRKEKGEYRFSLIDINRMQFRKKLSRRESLNGMKRLGMELPVLAEIARLYAGARGWSPEYTVGTFFTLRWKFLEGKRKKRARKERARKERARKERARKEK